MYFKKYILSTFKELISTMLSDHDVWKWKKIAKLMCYWDWKHAVNLIHGDKEEYCKYALALEDIND